MIHYKQGKIPETLENLEKALRTLIGLGLGESPNALTIKKNIEILKNEIK